MFDSQPSTMKLTAHKKNVFKLSLFKRLGLFYCYLNTRVAFPNPNKVLKKYNSDFTSKSV